VPSFTSDNLAQIGVLILTAVFYQMCGLLFALIVRYGMRLRAWRNGVLFAGIFSNWGTYLYHIKLES
jgi:auxin efflux carrier family protein